MKGNLKLISLIDFVINFRVIDITNTEYNFKYISSHLISVRFIFVIAIFHVASYYLKPPIIFVSIKRI